MCPRVQRTLLALNLIKSLGKLQLEHLKIVRNGHQHAKTTENEEVFRINAHPPVEKQPNKD